MQIFYIRRRRFFGGNDDIPKTMVQEFIYFYSDAFRPTDNLERYEPDRETHVSQMANIDA